MAGAARSEHYLGAGSQLFLLQPFELIDDATVDTLPHGTLELIRRNRTISKFYGSTGLIPPFEFLYHSINAAEENLQAISELHLQRIKLAGLSPPPLQPTNVVTLNFVDVLACRHIFGAPERGEC